MTLGYLVLFVVLSFLLIIRSYAEYGLAPPQDPVAAFARIFLPLGIDVLVGLRLYKWIRKLWDRSSAAGDSSVAGDSEVLDGVSKGSWHPDDLPEDPVVR